ncbi:hypothetical protein [Hafnia paralvei]|uniref:Uncharacterized protein n=1 Tax=Hafnia paralvei TaxID=546367 RepID=A0A2A2MIP3_9GAMM|nr:hypothetical protein [Hafnia paralvei]KHS42990.1 hypothetical protein RN38_18555 [Hafnia paralvei]PAV98591.1 hypothetical protein CJD50_03725 [Hafnia paralvei]
MTAEQDNAIRNVARRCNEAMKSAIKSAPKKTNIDTITRPILLSYYETIKPLGVSFLRFLWVIGVLNGQFEDK